VDCRRRWVGCGLAGAGGPRWRWWSRWCLRFRGAPAEGKSQHGRSGS